VKWLRSNIAAYPVAYVVLGVGLFTLVSAKPEWGQGKTDFNHFVSLILILGATVFLIWRWDQDRTSR
jgi:hypothetical protein